MSMLYKCDQKDCKYVGEEVYRVRVMFERTKEEVDKLWEVAKMRNPHTPREFVKNNAVVSIEMDLCKEHYDELKAKYFKGIK